MTQACKITLEVQRSLLPQLKHRLQAWGLSSYAVQPGRRTVYREGAPWAFWTWTTQLDEEPLELVELYYSGDDGALLRALVAELELNYPGRGSVYSEEVRLEGPALPLNTAPAPEGFGAPLFQDWALVSCVVQRGRAEPLCRAALDLGVSVPSVYFGQGSGLRERLGLLRVTIPAEKEIVNLIVPAAEAPDLMDTLIVEGRLNQPGRGFLYHAPLRFGLADTRLYRGPQRHVATMEQVILALDRLQGDTKWRRRAWSQVAGGRQKLEKSKMALVSVNLNCPNGTSKELISLARDLGAPGATTTQQTWTLPRASAFEAVRECAALVVPHDLLETVMAGWRDRGAFEAPGGLLVELKPVSESYSFLHRPAENS